MQRLTYRRRLSYSTTSNRGEIVKTPGLNRVYNYTKKLETTPKCADCKTKLHGVCTCRPSPCRDVVCPSALDDNAHSFHVTTKTRGTINVDNCCYIYNYDGGSRCVRESMVHAFWIESRRAWSVSLRPNRHQRNRLLPTEINQTCKKKKIETYMPC